MPQRFHRVVAASRQRARWRSRRGRGLAGTEGGVGQYAADALRCTSAFGAGMSRSMVSEKAVGVRARGAQYTGHA